MFKKYLNINTEESQINESQIKHTQSSRLRTQADDYVVETKPSPTRAPLTTRVIPNTFPEQNSKQKSQIQEQKPQPRRLFNSQLLDWDQVTKAIFNKHEQEKQSKELVRQPKSKSTKKIISSEGMVKDVPFPCVNRVAIDKSFRKSFQHFLEGGISGSQLISRINHEQHQLGDRKPKRFSFFQKRFGLPNTDKSKLVQLLDQESRMLNKKLQAQQNIQKIRDLIISKVAAKSEVDVKGRSPRLLSLKIFREMYQASDDWLDRIQTETDAIVKPDKKQLKTVHIKLNQQRPMEAVSVKKIKAEIATENTQLKKLLEDNCIEFLSQHQQKQAEIDTETKKSIRKQVENIQRKKYSLGNRDKYYFNDPSRQKENLSLYKDIELKRYISLQSISPTGNSPKPSKLTDTHLDMKDIKRLRSQQQFTRAVTDRSLDQSQMHSEDSGASSLQSAFEINLDELYNRSVGIQKRLKEHRFSEGFGKTIRSIQKLQDIQEIITRTNNQKLAGAKVQKIKYKDQ